MQTVLCDPNEPLILQLRFATDKDDKQVSLRCFTADQSTRWRQQLEFFVSDLYAERQSLSIKQNKSGYLWKEAISSKHMKNWRRRYANTYSWWLWTTLATNRPFRRRRT